tara:strand:+ start:29 stop:712 length:684 start_codon:yes stop_codon:yes gene_type:complete
MVIVDTVYQRVLTIANKEQRGYITPLEFNLLANQAQLDIFESYFVEMAQATAVPGNETEYSDIVKTLNEKISLFKTHASLVKVGSFVVYPEDMHKLGTVWFVGSGGIDDGIELQEINYNELQDTIGSPLISPTQSHPIYIRREEGLKIYPVGSWYNNKITASYIKRPKKVEWGYVVTNEQALYNASASTNFDLHASEEIVLIAKILGLAGITIQKQDLMAVEQQQQA